MRWGVGAGWKGKLLSCIYKASLYADLLGQRVDRTYALLYIWKLKKAREETHGLSLC